MLRQPLHLKYRPKILDDLIGQKDIITRIKGMIKKKDIPSTILFTGSTGLGKTTSMRILARTLNCDTMTGCGKCRNCIAFDNLNHPDYSEMNVGDQRGIDDMRSLLQKSKMLPQLGHLRIIALDEIQNLTPQSRELMLKPLEEPPAHTLWVLGSMEPERLTTAILTRCQIFQLKPIKKEELSNYLLNTANKENVLLKEDICDLIAEISGGSTRQCLQILESVIQYMDGIENKEQLTNKMIKSVIVNAISVDNDDLIVSKLLKAIILGNNKMLHQCILDVSNYISFINKLTSAVLFCSASLAGIDNHEKLYHNIINKESLSILTTTITTISNKYKIEDSIVMQHIIQMLSNLLQECLTIKFQLFQFTGTQETVLFLSSLQKVMFNFKATRNKFTGH